MKPENWVYEHYHEFAEKITPVLRATLRGGRDVPQQKPITEAWLAYALFPFERPVPLEEIIGSADAISHGIPKPDEVAWAFLSLTKRGWLSDEGDKYSLTNEGRHAINTIIAQGNLERLNDWISNHPPNGRITAKDVFMSLGKKNPQ